MAALSLYNMNVTHLDDEAHNLAVLGWRVRSLWDSPPTGTFRVECGKRTWRRDAHRWVDEKDAVATWDDDFCPHALAMMVSPDFCVCVDGRTLVQWTDTYAHRLSRSISKVLAECLEDRSGVRARVVARLLRDCEHKIEHSAAARGRPDLRADGRALSALCDTLESLLTLIDGHTVGMPYWLTLLVRAPKGQNCTSTPRDAFALARSTYNARTVDRLLRATVGEKGGTVHIGSLAIRFDYVTGTWRFAPRHLFDRGTKALDVRRTGTDGRGHPGGRPPQSMCCCWAPGPVSMCPPFAHW